MEPWTHLAVEGGAIPACNTIGGTLGGDGHLGVTTDDAYLETEDSIVAFPGDILRIVGNQRWKPRQQ